MGSRAFNSLQPMNAKDEQVNIYADTDDIYSIDEPIIDVDINEEDFFIPPPDPEIEFDLESSPDPDPVSLVLDVDVKKTDDDLSKYIDKCKEEYARKKKKKRKKKTDTTPCIAKEDRDFGGEKVTEV